MCNDWMRAIAAHEFLLPIKLWTAHYFPLFAISAVIFHLLGLRSCDGHRTRQHRFHTRDGMSFVRRPTVCDQIRYHERKYIFGLYSMCEISVCAANRKANTNMVQQAMEEFRAETESNYSSEPLHAVNLFFIDFDYEHVTRLRFEWANQSWENFGRKFNTFSPRVIGFISFLLWPDLNRLSPCAPKKLGKGLNLFLIYPQSWIVHFPFSRRLIPPL